MFERYTEKARRAIFFARYEASQLGSPYIESEHFLLGLLRENRKLASLVTLDRDQLMSRLSSVGRVGEKIATSVDLPFANSTKRILAYAAEEAERMSHQHIGSEHLLLGILREENCTAAKLLREMGAPSLEAVRIPVKESGAKDDTPAGMASQLTGLPLRVKLIDESSGKELAGRSTLLLGIPRICDAVSIELQQDTIHKFRVIDVEWAFATSSGEEDLRTSGITIRLRSEPK